MERALYRSLLRSANTRQRNLQKLRDADVPRALSKLCDAAGAIAPPSESAEVGAELAAAVRNLPSFDDLESTCKWTRYQLRAHNDSPRAACRARFTETAKELAMIRAMADDSAVQGSTNSNADSHMETGHAGADAEFREWAEALPDPRVTKLLLSMRYAEESERVDQGFEGLRLLDELNAHVGRLMAVLGISSGDEAVAVGVDSDDSGVDIDPVRAWLRQHGHQQQQAPPSLATFGTAITDPYGSLEQLAALEQLEQEVLDMSRACDEALEQLKAQLEDEPDDGSDTDRDLK